jgi:hypothetical protein
VWANLNTNTASSLIHQIKRPPRIPDSKLFATPGFQDIHEGVAVKQIAHFHDFDPCPKEEYRLPSESIDTCLLEFQIEKSTGIMALV